VAGGRRPTGWLSLSRPKERDSGHAEGIQNPPPGGAYGNITKSVPINGTGITWNPGYNPANNHYTFGGTSYDNNGNLTNDTFNQYTWDAYGQMATINGNAITYDALGREVEKSNPTREILYSPVGKVAIMNGATSVVTSFVPMPGGSSMNTLSGQTEIRHMNLQGTVSVLSTLLGRSINEDKAFAPFGEVYNVGAAGIGETDFAGMSQDTLTGMNDSATRKQYPNQGRWLSPDPAGLAAVNFGNPQTWNRYAYVGNNPISYIDPMGLKRRPCSNPGGEGCGGDPAGGNTSGFWMWNPFDLFSGLGLFCENGDCGHLYIPGASVFLFTYLPIDNSSDYLNYLTNWVTGRTHPNTQYKLVRVYDCFAPGDGRRNSNYALEGPPGVSTSDAVITEHLSNPDISAPNAQPGIGTFQDQIGTNGTSATGGSLRYFTVTNNGENLGLVPVQYQNGASYAVEGLWYNIDLKNPQNSQVFVNGSQAEIMMNQGSCNN
jgi:RHS repeat-associated protein